MDETYTTASTKTCIYSLLSSLRHHHLVLQQGPGPCYPMMFTVSGDDQANMKLTAWTPTKLRNQSHGIHVLLFSSVKQYPNILVGWVVGYFVHGCFQNIFVGVGRFPIQNNLVGNDCGVLEFQLDPMLSRDLLSVHV